MCRGCWEDRRQRERQEIEQGTTQHARVSINVVQVRFITIALLVLEDIREELVCELSREVPRDQARS